MSRLRVENPQPRHQFTPPFANTSFLRKFIAGNNSEATTAEGIYRANIGLIAEADALLANLNPFRGTEPDSGTVFEIGYAIALGKRVVGYLEDARSQTEKLAGDDRRKGNIVDHNGFSIENFGLPVNLMLGIPCEIVEGGLLEALEYLQRWSSDFLNRPRLYPYRR